MPTHSPRVAHLIQYFAIGGLERMVQQLATESQARGIESVVIGYLADGPIRGELERSGIPTVLLESQTGVAPGRCLQLYAALRRHRIDVLHTHHLGPFIYGAPAATLLRLPTLHTEHSHELYDSMRRRAVGALMSRFARVVAVTPEIAAYRRRQFGDGCRVIRNGVRLAPDATRERAGARARLGIAEHEFVFGCVARLAPEKDHATLLTAFVQLHKAAPHTRLMIIGDGPERSALVRLAQSLGISSHVDWLGSRGDVCALYPALDACVLTSTREGLPLALLEAMAQRVPVIATAVGGIPELLQDGAGLLVAPSNPSVVALAMIKLATDRGLARALGQQGFERVATRYACDAMVDSYIALYRELHAGSASGAHGELASCA